VLEYSIKDSPIPYHLDFMIGLARRCHLAWYLSYEVLSLLLGSFDMVGQHGDNGAR
jgi:hypothetical protein